MITHSIEKIPKRFALFSMKTCMRLPFGMCEFQDISHGVIVENLVENCI